MSVTSHLNELRRKHETLELMIEEQERAPSSDHVAITKLKRQKLRLKEEIERTRAVEA